MKATKTPNTDEMAELYRTTAMAQQQIGALYGIGGKAVNRRLAWAGIKRRPPKHRAIKKAELNKLFREDRLPLKKIVAHFQITVEVVRAALEFHGIPRDREPVKSGGIRADFLRTLQIGETRRVALDLKKPQSAMHGSARNIGIRISIRAAGKQGDGNFAVTRIA